MTSPRLLNDGEDLKSLAERLGRCQQVTGLDLGDDREAWTLAHAFGDLEESFRTFLDEQLPRLTGEKLTPGDTYDLLLDIGEQFRHILYHINDPKFYRYLRDDA